MRALQLDPGNHRELLLRLFFAAPLEIAQLRGHVEAFRREQQARLEHNEDTREWLDDAQVHNPRLPIWKLVLEYGVLFSESRVIHTPSLFFNGSGQQT